MLLPLILSCVAIGIFVVYNIIAICLFGMPSSLSNTFYYYDKRWPGSGWIFTAMMWLISFLLIYPWLHVNSLMSSWSDYLGVLPFLTCASLLFVATAPNFRSDSLTSAVHMTCAKLAAVFAILWICIVCWKIMYVIPAWILLCGGIAHLTKTAKSGRDWWIEMCAFGPTFTCIIVEEILHL